jgi:eukaryotic-like serine/threonine-protein kinase
MQDLPFQMLLILLEHPGELVSREELQKRLWGQDVFVEVDNSLHVAAARLREAIGDRATDPTYIKTISGRGYRFIGDVTPVYDMPVRAASEPVTTEPTLTIATSAGSPSKADPAKETKPGKIRLPPPAVLWSLLGIALAAAAISIYWYRSAHRPLAGVRDRIVVGGFANHTGDYDLDGTLGLALRVKLEESPYLNLIPDQRFRQQIKKPDGAALQDELHACANLGGQVLLRGQIIQQASQYELQLSAWRCADGRLLATQKAHADSQEWVLTALNTVTQQMRGRLGESNESLRKYDTPIAQATTGSLNALKAFILGEEKRAHGEEADAISSYKLAIDLDPQFALAYARLGTIYANAEEFALSRQYYQKAFDLRERTTEAEQLYIVSHYYTFATGEIQRSIEAYELGRSAYPRDMSSANNLALQYMVLGQPEKAVEPARAAIDLDPAAEFPYATLAQAYLSSGDYSGAQKLCSDPVREGTNIMQFHQTCFTLAFVQNDEAGMSRQLDWSRGTPQESALIEAAARVALYRGQLRQARQLFSEARQNALRNNLPESAAEILQDQALFEADLGFVREATESAQAAMKLAPNSAFVQAFAALALARAGDSTAAEAAANKAASQSPSDTILNSAVLASVRAAIQLERHNPTGAVQSLEGTRPYDANSFMALSSPYYRGLAYMQEQKWQEAAREFHWVLDHRALAPDSLYVVLSQIELGRTLQLSGDAAAANRVFNQLEETWKNADPDFPPIAQLHAYQRQQSSP